MISLFAPQHRSSWLFILLQAGVFAGCGGESEQTAVAPSPTDSTVGTDTTSASTGNVTTTPSATSTPGGTSTTTTTSPSTISPTTGSPTSNPSSSSSTSSTPGSNTSPGASSDAETNTTSTSADTRSEAPGGPRTSKGCGTQTSLQSGNATITVGGTQRQYILDIPSDYDPNKPYKLVFGLHWRGGQASDVASGTIGLGDYYGLKSLAQGSTIFVSPNGIDNGWANTNGRDIAFMRGLMELFDNELCIDLERVFSVGFSFGGMMSFAIACEMGDVFRAIAPLSGALYSGCGNGTEPVAMWGAHGKSDDVVPIDDGRKGVAEVLKRNGCSEQTTAVEPSPCVTYSGCAEGYPVTWCEFDGGHSPQRWQSQPIWDFFSQF